MQCEENNAPLVLNWFDQRLFRSLVGHDAELKRHRFSPLIVLELLGLQSLIGFSIRRYQELY